MRLTLGKLVVLLVLIVALLQTLHLFLLNRLKRKLGLLVTSSTSDSHEQFLPDVNSEFSYSGETVQMSMFDVLWKQDIVDNLNKDLRDMVESVQKSSILDSSGDYKVVNYLAQSDSLKKKYTGYGDDITLVTQCSQDHLFHLISLYQYWDGPVSIAVFVADHNLIATLVSIAELRQCYTGLRNHTSFHLVYPLLHYEQNLYALIDKVASRWSGIVAQDLPASCNQFKAQSNIEIGADLKHRGISGAQTYAQDVAYPNNLLRNVARRNALTEFIFVIDVDMLPNIALHHDFVAFAQAKDLFQHFEKDDKTVYIVPVFEVQKPTNIPKDKASLLQLLNTFQARPFYSELCWKCQKYTDYEKWQGKPITDVLSVSYEVPWKDPWEPFYVARNIVPFYDERFKQYGFNRISQVCELHVAGYKFCVLNNAFLVHQGLKTLNSFHRRKDEEQENNRLLFRQFKAELKEKYPESSRRCY